MTTYLSDSFVSGPSRDRFSPQNAGVSEPFKDVVDEREVDEGEFDESYPVTGISPVVQPVSTMTTE